MHFCLSILAFNSCINGKCYCIKLEIASRFCIVLYFQCWILPSWLYDIVNDAKIRTNFLVIKSFGCAILLEELNFLSIKYLLLIHDWSFPQNLWYHINSLLFINMYRYLHALTSYVAIGIIWYYVIFHILCVANRILCILIRIFPRIDSSI